MVQYGILLMGVVMKINIKKVVPPLPSVGVCGEECQEVRVQIGTECPGVHNVFGYCS